MFVVSLVSRYMERPTNLHMQAIKRALRYVKGLVDLGIYYKKGAASDEILMAFSDSDYAGYQDDHRFLCYKKGAASDEMLMAFSDSDYAGYQDDHRFLCSIGSSCLEFEEATSGFPINNQGRVYICSSLCMDEKNA